MAIPSFDHRSLPTQRPGASQQGLQRSSDAGF
jgi:hypothetical protein